MKIHFLAFAVVHGALALGAFGQTASDLNEGTKLEYDSVNSIWRFKWWGRSGNTYFIQHSEDLQTWNWLPMVVSGADSVEEWGFTSNSEKFFWRLRFTDQETSDPEGSDFDSDSLGNLFEVQQGLNPFRVDSDGDGMPDGYELANGLSALVDDSELDLDGDFVPNREDAKPNDGNVGRLGVNISLPADGATIP